jgi:uncharacterized protein (DUF1330 family)
MSAYVVVEIEVHNQELYKSYTQLTPASIAAYQGKFVVRGGETIVLEGDWQPKRLALLEFPSMEIANSWWHSEDYTKAREIRQQAATTKMIIVDGV